MGIECQTPQCVFAAVVAELKSWNTAQTFQLERCVFGRCLCKRRETIYYFWIGLDFCSAAKRRHFMFFENEHLYPAACLLLDFALVFLPLKG
jgi:hypothetical protein